MSLFTFKILGILLPVVHFFIVYSCAQWCMSLVQEAKTSKTSGEASLPLFGVILLIPIATLLPILSFENSVNDNTRILSESVLDKEEAREFLNSFSMKIGLYIDDTVIQDKNIKAIESHVTTSYPHCDLALSNLKERKTVREHVGILNCMTQQ